MTPMLASASSLLALLIEHTWQSTAIATAATALTLLFRRHAAGVRHAIYLAASIKFLVPIAVLTAAGTFLPWPIPVNGPVEASAVSIAAPPAGSSRIGIETAVAAPRLPGEPSLLPALLVAVWGAGALLVAGRRIGAVCRTMALRWRAAPLLAGREYESFRRSVPDASAAAIRLAASTEIDSPGVTGIVSPVLLWPARLVGRLTDPQIDAIMRHEVAHVRSRHNLSGALQAVVETIFWWHPMVWWLGRRLESEQERACDERVLASGIPARDYAAVLLDVCERSLLRRPIRSIGVGSSGLQHRVEVIMTAAVPRPLSVAGKMALACLLAGVVAIPLAAGAQNAQATAAALSGVVTDDTGAAVAGATVAVRTTAAGAAEASATTDKSGRYRISSLVPGQYEVRVTRDGFRPHVSQFTLPGGETTRNAELSLGTVTESLTLTPGGQAPPVGNEKELLQQIAQRPEDEEAYLDLAELYYRQERFEESAAAMDRAVRVIGARAPAARETTSSGGEIDPPRLLRSVLPVYPTEALAARVAGTVIVAATIAEDGTVQDPHLLRSVPMLNDAAIGAVRQRLYTPVRLNGVPVPVEATMTIAFALE